MGSTDLDVAFLPLLPCLPPALSLICSNLRVFKRFLGDATSRKKVLGGVVDAGVVVVAVVGVDAVSWAEDRS